MIEAAVGHDSAHAAAAQQKDNLCGPFHGARVLNDAGVSEWEGMPIDQDLVAVHAGTTLPARPEGPQVPPGAVSITDYRFELARVGSERAGTMPSGLLNAITMLSARALACVPLRGRWSEQGIESLLCAAPGVGARLIANIRTGPLWTSRPPAQALVAELAGERASDVPGAEWDVGHYVELAQLVRGPGGALVVVRDSYPSLGWMGHHLQPPRALAAALERGDGRGGGVLAVVPPGGEQAVLELAPNMGLEAQLWAN
jgi:hypothetical protein